jgi:hypothetical protein
VHSSISNSKLWAWSVGSVGAGLLGFAALLGASEYMVRARVEPNDHFWRNASVFMSAKTGNAAFGDSIPARGFHGVEGFVNLAMPGEAPVVTELKVSAFYQTRTPTNVIISLNPNLFRRSAQISLQQYKDIYLAPREPLLRIFKQRHKERMLGYWMVWLSGRDFHNNVRVPSNGGILMRDSGANDTWWKKPDPVRLEDAAENVARDMVAENFRSHENLKVLSRVTALVRAKGGTVCFVTFPYSPEYRAAAIKYPRFAEVRTFFREFAQATGARYADFWTRYDDRNLYLDPSHLNEAGAKRFSTEAVRECFGDRLAPTSTR